MQARARSVYPKKDRGGALLYGRGVFRIFVLAAGVYFGFFPFSINLAPWGVHREGGVYSQYYGM